MSEQLEVIFDLDGVVVEDASVEGELVTMKGRLRTERTNCPKCGCKHTIFKNKRKRRLHLPPVGSRRGQLEIIVRRCQCTECMYKWWPQLPCAEGKQRVTHAFVAHVLDLLKMGTVNDVARHLGIGWDAVKDIHKNYLSEEYAEIDLSGVEYISIDEFAIRKGHTYMTIVSDCRTGRIIHAVEGRKAEDIKPFLEELKKSA